MSVGIVTICEGERFVPWCERLGQTLKEHSDFPLHVYTYTGEFENADQIVKFPSFSKAPTRMNATFNYNLKGIATKHMFNTTDYDQIVFLDCDIVMTKPTLAFTEEMSTGDVWGNFSNFGVAHQGVQSGAKYKEIMAHLGFEKDFFLSMKYFTETMLLLNRTAASQDFVNNWGWVCEEISQTRINPAYECVELGIAMHISGDVECNQLKATSLKRDQTFLTEHRDKMLPVVQN